MSQEAAAAEEVPRLSDGPLLLCDAVAAGYGALPVIHDVTLEVQPGEVVALLGPNGAGKTTTLRTLAGVLHPLAGTVQCLGESERASLHKRARRGLAYVSEQRSIFTRMSVLDNLRVAGVKPAEAVGVFPELGNLLKRRAGLLSGGEQQMLTLARALARRPRILLADELSLGLAPLIVDRLLETVRRAADGGTAVLLVEQHSRKALSIADRGYIMQRGRVVLHGDTVDLQDKLAEIEALHLGDDRGIASPPERRRTSVNGDRNDC
jgi:branched-chain amino acid transport system ATP-binding protein